MKPANILVTTGRDGGEHAYLCDFGLAKHASTVSSLTSERALVGTIDYVAPEQIEGGAVDGRADVYALGCVLYECLAGAPPFARGIELAVVYAHLNDPPPRRRSAGRSCRRRLDDVIARALAKAPADRYATAGELAAAAGAAVAGEQPDTPPPAPPPRARTFLIADVRGYTTYTRQHGDEAAAALAARVRGARAGRASSCHRGELVELRGDEALAVFDSSRDALRAAVALQRQARAAPTRARHRHRARHGRGDPARAGLPRRGAQPRRAALRGGRERSGARERPRHPRRRPGRRHPLRGDQATAAQRPRRPGERRRDPPRRALRTRRRRRRAAAAATPRATEATPADRRRPAVVAPVAVGAALSRAAAAGPATAPTRCGRRLAHDDRPGHDGSGASTSGRAPRSWRAPTRDLVVNGVDTTALSRLDLSTHAMRTDGLTGPPVRSPPTRAVSGSSARPVAAPVTSVGLDLGIGG